MSLIRELERRLESVLEGFFSRQFKSGLQPIEIAKRLAREMDENLTVSVSKTYAPNTFAVLISRPDYERLSAFSDKLCEELSDFLTAHAQREGYAVIGRPIVSIKGLDELNLGEFRIDCSLVDRVEIGEKPAESREKAPLERASKPEASAEGTRVLPALSALAALDFPDAGKKYPITKERTTIGRAAVNDVVIPDQSVSRRHAEIVVSGKEFVLRDLESRNGTFLNGRRISSRSLRDGDEIRVGMTSLFFRRRGVV